MYYKLMIKNLLFHVTDVSSIQECEQNDQFFQWSATKRSRVLRTLGRLYYQYFYKYIGARH